MELYIIIALISTGFFGANAIIQKSAKNIDAISLALFSLLTATILTFLYWIFFHSKKEISTQGLGYAILSGIVFAVAIVLFIIALQRGKTSVVVTINALSAGVAVILAVVLLGDTLTAIKVFGVILGIIAVVFLSI